MKQPKKRQPISSEEGNSLDMYFDEISRQQLLSADEEQALATRIQQGDRKAVDRLVMGNLRLVIAIAKAYQGQGIALADLINEGNIGLIKAAEAFHHAPFAPQASKAIRKAIEKALLEQSSDRQGLNRETSVDAPLWNNERLTMLDLLPNGAPPAADIIAEGNNQRDILATHLNELEERERAVVTAFYGIDQPVMTLAEIAFQLGIKRERARQIRDKAIRKLKKKI